MSQAFAYVRNHYNVPACRGRRVIAYGKPGTITADFGHYIGIVLDEDVKRHPGRYHPTDGIVYGEMADKLPKPPRRSNWDRYYDEEWTCDFHEFLEINLPVYQERETDGVREFRMVRYPRGESYRPTYDWGYYVEVAGEWMTHKPDAKASYKTALYKYLAEERTEKKRRGY